MIEKYPYVIDGLPEYNKLKWCDHHYGHRGTTWIYRSYRFYFKNENDAMHFKLKWGDLSNATIKFL